MKKLFLIALAASLFVAACELPTESPKLPVTQDFTVTEDWICDASDYYLNGVLTIAEGGSITFTGSTLHVNGEGAQNGIDVYGSATFEETTVTSTSEALGEDDNYFFTVNEGATFSFENGEIKHCGADVTGKRSLVIEADEATIYNSIFSSNGLNLVVEADGVNASKNNFGQTGIAGRSSISLKGLNLIFEDNEVNDDKEDVDAISVSSSTGSFSNNVITNTNSSGNGLGADNVNASSFKGLTLSAGGVAIHFENCESNDASFIELTGNIGIGPKAKDNVLDLAAVGSGNLNEFDSTSEGTTIRGGKYSEIKAKLGESRKNVLIGVEFDEDAVLYGEEIVEVRDSQFVGTKGVKISNECANSEECTQMVFSGNALSFPAVMGFGGGVMQDADGLNALLTINGSNLLIEDNDLDAGEEGTAYYFKNAGDVEVTAGETSGKRLAYFEGSSGVTLEQEPGATGFSLKQELKRLSFADCSCWIRPDSRLGLCCVEPAGGCGDDDPGNGVYEACQECLDHGNDLESKELCTDAYAEEQNNYGDECSGEDAVIQYSCNEGFCVDEPAEACPDGTHCDDGACVSDDANCGDGFCTHPETCTTCAEDCGDCFDANPAIVFEESNECSVKNFDFSGPVLVHAKADSNQNKVEQNSFEEAKIVLEGYANAFNENVFTGQCNLTLYGDYSEVAYNAFKELNDFRVIGRNANVTGNVQSSGLAGSGNAVILVTGKNAAFTNNEFLLGAEITGPGGVVGSEDKFYFADTAVASLELSGSALVEWVSGETGGVTFADEGSRLRRGWHATLRFIDKQSEEEVELAEDFVITDAKGNEYVCEAGSATCDPGDLFEGVYSQEHVVGVSGENKASFAGDWEDGSYNPYSYDGGEFEVTGDGVIPIKLFFGGECAVDADCPPGTPYCVAGVCVECLDDGDCAGGETCEAGFCESAAVDDENPAGVFMEFTAPKRSQIAGDVEVQIVTQYNGENNCPELALTVGGPEAVAPVEEGCSNGVTTFLLEDLQTPGDYSLQAIATDYPSAGETSTASTTFKLIGSAPIATPDVHWAAALFAAAIGFYAFSKRK